jgi:branched-chain amino acid transport system permease protein
MRSSLDRMAASSAGNLMLLLLVALGGLVYSSSGSGARDQLVTDMLVNVIIVVGVQVFVGNTGVLSFGHLGFASIAAYATALLSIPVAKKATLLPRAPWGLKDAHVNIMVATAVGVVLALVAGVLIGAVMARLTGLAATMITLAFLFMVEAVAKNYKNLTNGAGNLSGIPRLEGRVWILVLSAIVVVVASAFRYTRLGRLAQATREDELAARAMGINLGSPRFAALVLSAGIVGLGGSLRTQSLGAISPSQFSFDLTILVLAMLVVGAMRTVSGAIVGTVIISVGKEFTRFLGDGPEWLGFTWPKVEDLPGFFLAIALLAILLLRPTGLLGGWDAGQLLQRLWRSRSAPTSSAVPAAAATASPATASPSGASSSGAIGESLYADGLGVTFGGFTALEDVSLEVAPGTVHGLIGPNGAGKTTFVNALTGVVSATTGSARVGTTRLSGNVHHIARAGVARTFQNLRVFGALSVRENIEIAALVAHKHRADRTPIDIDALLHQSGLTDVAERDASTLDYGNQRRLEIARAAALRPSFLLLDEPTSGMSDSESAAMVQHVRATAALCGAGVLVIDHDLAFITALCDQVTVLDQGKVLTAGTPAHVKADPRVIAAYIGTRQ